MTSQSTWIKALAYLANHQYKVKPLSKVRGNFHRYWQPTEVIRVEDGKMVIKCLGKDPEHQKAWLEDRGEGIAEKALIAVTGKSYEVEYVIGEEE